MQRAPADWPMALGMPRYLFHAYVEDDAIDEEGADLPDFDAAKAHAIECARDMIAEDARHGFIDLSHRIEVEDETGVVAFVIYYRDAIELRGI